MRKYHILVILSALLMLSGAGVALAQEVASSVPIAENETQINEIVDTTQESVSPDVFINLTDKVVTYNLLYLGISVSVIISLGVMFYIFNFRPLLDKIEKQETNFKTFRKEIGKELDSKIDSQDRSSNTKSDELRKEIRISRQESQDRILDFYVDAQKKNEELSKKIDSKIAIEIADAKKIIEELKLEIKEKMSTLEDRSQELELSVYLNKYWMWDRTGVPTNALTSLVEYINLSLDYNKQHRIYEFILEKIIILLDEKDLSALIKAGAYRSSFEELFANLEKIEGKDDLKDKIRKLLERHLA